MAIDRCIGCDGAAADRKRQEMQLAQLLVAFSTAGAAFLGAGFALAKMFGGRVMWEVAGRSLRSCC